MCTSIFAARAGSSGGLGGLARPPSWGLRSVGVYLALRMKLLIYLLEELPKLSASTSKPIVAVVCADSGDVTIAIRGCDFDPVDPRIGFEQSVHGEHLLSEPARIIDVDHLISRRLIFGKSEKKRRPPLALEEPFGLCPAHAPMDALEQSNFQLLEDPEGSFEAGHGMEFGEQLAPAGVVAAKCEHDQPEQGAGSEPEHHEGDQQGPPGHDGVKQLRDHQANLPRSERNRASLRASWRSAPSAILPSSVSS